MHSYCSCISKRKLIEWLILQVTDVWKKPIAKMVRNNIILSITPKAVLLFLCLYLYIRASTISLVSVLNIWTAVCAKIDISKQPPSSFLHSCRNACEKLCAEWQEQTGSEETCPFAGTSNIPLPAHARLEAKINDPLGFSISLEFLILQVQGSISLPSSILVVKQPVSWGGSSGWQEMLFKIKLFIWAPKLRWRPSEWYPWPWACI